MHYVEQEEEKISLPLAWYGNLNVLFDDSGDDPYRHISVLIYMRDNKGDIIFFPDCAAVIAFHVFYICFDRDVIWIFRLDT